MNSRILARYKSFIIIIIMFCGFSLKRETAGMRLRRFPAQESRKKRSRKVSRKITMDRVFETTFIVIFCNLDVSGKVI